MRSLRVRLLSMPQARHAPAIAKIPAPPPFGPPPRQDNKSEPPRIAAAPTNSRLSTFSRKTSQAKDSDARPSRIRSTETVERWGDRGGGNTGARKGKTRGGQV